MKNKTLLLIAALVIVLGSVVYLSYFTNQNTLPISALDDSLGAPITYNNAEYGFDFTLPANWQGYSIIQETWTGTTLMGTSTQGGPKLLIRNPKWTESVPYEDLPILVFTTSQWEAYTKEQFAVSTAPIKASELGRNNMYVFALPPRWDFDYRLEYKEAQDIMAGSPLEAFDLGVSQSKLDIDTACEQSLSYMNFVDGKSAEAYVTECKEGKYPEVTLSVFGK